MKCQNCGKHEATIRYMQDINGVKDELYLILLGFRISQCNGKTIPYIYIGYIPFTLTELFDEYEWQETDTGDWKPFGVEG